MFSFYSIQLSLLRIVLAYFLVFIINVELFSQCDNQIQFPYNTVSIGTGLTTISDNIYAGEYSVTNNYINNSEYLIKSLNTSDYLTLRSTSDSSVIVHGYTPLNFTYQSQFYNVEIHVNTNSNCGTDQIGRTLTAQSFCKNTNQYPLGNRLISCGENLIADDIFAGDYFQTYGYEIGKQAIFSSSNPTDYITLRRSNGELIVHGLAPLIITYQASYGDIAVHINKNENCDKRDVARSIIINRECICNNYSQVPDNTVTLSCGNNIINNMQYAGEFNSTTGYIHGKEYIFNSSIRTDHLTLRNGFNNSLIAEGTTPLSITYYNYMGDIKMHVNPNSFCGSDEQTRVTYINVDCSCDALAFSASLDTVSCIDTTTFLSYAGESKNTTGYEVGQTYTFTSSISTDYFTLRKTWDNKFLASGQSPLTFIPEEIVGQIEVHVFSDSLCGEDLNTVRDIAIFGVCSCYSPSLFPIDTIIINCDTNLIAANQYAGEYNISTGYVHGRNATFTSSIATDFITVRKTNGKSVIAESLTPLTIVYDELMGDIEMHISTNDMCGTQDANRTTTIILECVDTDNDGIDEYLDNCPEISNPLQSDFDLDGIGDVCDEDEVSINNVGIGSENPNEKLHVKDGSIYIDKPLGGIILKTINGTCVKIVVNEIGDLIYFPVDCPGGN